MPACLLGHFKRVEQQASFKGGRGKDLGHVILSLVLAGDVLLL